MVRVDLQALRLEAQIPQSNGHIQKILWRWTWTFCRFVCSTCQLTGMPSDHSQSCRHTLSAPILLWPFNFSQILFIKYKNLHRAEIYHKSVCTGVRTSVVNVATPWWCSCILLEWAMVKIMIIYHASLDILNLSEPLCAGDETGKKPYSDSLPLHHLAGPWCAYWTS